MNGINQMDGGFRRAENGHKIPAQRISPQVSGLLEGGIGARFVNHGKADETILAVERGPERITRTRSGTLLHKLAAANREAVETSAVSAARVESVEREHLKKMRRVLSWNALPVIGMPLNMTGEEDVSGKAKAMGPSNLMFLAADWVWRGSKYSGILCLVSGALLYSLMRLLVKLLAVKSIPSFETVMFRSFVIACVALTCCLHRGDNPFGRKKVRHLLIARALIGFLSISSLFFSIQMLPLRDAAMLNFTMPVFTAVLGRIFLAEPWHLREAFGSLVSLTGVILITRPPSLFPTEALVDAGVSGKSRQAAAHNPVGVTIALFGAAAGAGAYILLRKVGKLAEPPMVVVFVFAAISLPLSALGMLIFQHFVVPSAMQLMALVGVGLAAFAAQVLVTRGLQLEKASRAASMQYVTVLATYSMGVAFLGEMPTLFGVFGAALVALSASFVAIKGA